MNSVDEALADIICSGAKRKNAHKAYVYATRMGEGRGATVGVLLAGIKKLAAAFRQAGVNRPKSRARTAHWFATEYAEGRIEMADEARFSEDAEFPKAMRRG